MLSFLVPRSTAKVVVWLLVLAVIAALRLGMSLVPAGGEASPPRCTPVTGGPGYSCEP